MDEKGENYVASQFVGIGWPREDVREAIGVFAAMNGTHLPSYNGDWNEFIDPIRRLGLDLDLQDDVDTMIESFQMFRQAQSLSRTRGENRRDERKGFIVEYKVLAERGFAVNTGSEDNNRKTFYKFLERLKDTTDAKLTFTEVSEQVIRQSNIGHQFVAAIGLLNTNHLITQIETTFSGAYFEKLLAFLKYISVNKINLQTHLEELKEVKNIDLKSNKLISEYFPDIFKFNKRELQTCAMLYASLAYMLIPGEKNQIDRLAFEISTSDSSRSSNEQMEIFLVGIEKGDKKIKDVEEIELLRKLKSARISNQVITDLIATLEYESEDKQLKQLLRIMNKSVPEVPGQRLMAGFLNLEGDKKMDNSEDVELLRRLKAAGISLKVIDAIVEAKYRHRIELDVNFLDNVISTSTNAANFAKATFEIMLMFIRHAGEMANAAFATQDRILTIAVNEVKKISVNAGMQLAAEIGSELKRGADAVDGKVPIDVNLKAINEFLSDRRLEDFESAIVILSSMFHVRDRLSPFEYDRAIEIKFNKWYDEVKKYGYVLATRGNDQFDDFTRTFETAVYSLRTSIDKLVVWDSRKSLAEEELHKDVHKHVKDNLDALREKVTLLIQKMVVTDNPPALDFTEVFGDSKFNASSGFALKIKELDDKVKKYTRFIIRINVATEPLNKINGFGVTPDAVYDSGAIDYINAVGRSMDRLGEISRLEKLASELENKVDPDIVSYCKAAIEYRKEMERQLQKIRAKLFLNPFNQQIDAIVTGINQMADTNTKWIGVTNKLTAFYNDVMVDKVLMIEDKATDGGILMAKTTNAEIVIEALKQMFETVKRFDKELTDALYSLAKAESRNLVAQLRLALNPKSTVSERKHFTDLLRSDFVDRVLVN